jgi:hypothetical protein
VARPFVIGDRVLVLWDWTAPARNRGTKGTVVEVRGRGAEIFLGVRLGSGMTVEASVLGVELLSIVDEVAALGEDS